MPGHVYARTACASRPAIALLAMLLLRAAIAQNVPNTAIAESGALPDYRMRQQDFAAREVVVRHLAGNVYVVAGAGSNITALAGDDGILLVDGSYAQMNDKVVAALRRISDKPIRFLVNTHFHGDHTGANENFARLGATVIASAATRVHLQGQTPPDSHPAPYAALVANNPAPPAAAGARPAPGFGGAVPAAALPTIVLTQPLTLYMDGEEVTILPAPHIEHTEGDLFVYFHHANVMALGDDYTTDYPAINPAAGGTSQNAIDNFNAALAMTDAATRFVPGHGQISSRQDLTDLRDAVIAIRERIRAMVAQGQSLEQVKAARPSRQWDARFAMENVGHNDVFSTDRWYNIMYAEAQQYDKERRAN
jgi:glyoxylase-like metal-dependent hydrolase (beta-lactamase superfamily II)